MDEKNHDFENFFWPLHSDFGSKLSGESFFFGPLIQKISFFPNMDIFIRLAK